ncbi:YhgE/Pip family protein [Pseudonocardia sp. TRM90224]|uniref:YhgE/Pip family protein n=1 Tax=Pseudonocardia sp. TRM90224 TaxID=2812678 RepID=UPI001E3B98CD|nr:YhgE/Pip domain-containing protein [Pseudonocardia sp. TRM90224]
MTLVRLAALELRRFHTPLQRAALVFAACVPLIYGATYLWSNWDPYARLDQIPVAVVVEDQPVTVDGKRVAAGELFTDELRKDPIFDWRFVDRAEADRGLAESDYYFLIAVPQDFSTKLASGATGTPQRAAMQIVLDDANGYIVGKMAETVQVELTNKIDAAAVSAYFLSVFGNLDQLHSGVASAADGAAKLRAGADQARSGSSALADGITQLKTGADQLAPGAQQVSDGVGDIAGVVVPVANRIAGALPSITTPVADAATAAAGLAQSAASAAAAVDSDANSVVKALAALGEDNPRLADDPVYLRATAAATRAAGLTSDVSSRAGKLRDTTATIATDTRSIAADTPQLQAKLRTAAADVQRLSDGAKAVSDGAKRLDTGLGSAQTGANQLVTGTGQLADGAGQLATGLAGAVAQIPSLDPESKRTNAATLASPVDVTTSNLHPATQYGRGLAPLFFGVAMWVFGIVAFLLLRPLSGRARASGASSLTVALAGYLPALAGSLVAVAVLDLVVDLGLGLAPVHPFAHLGLIALGAAAFVAIAHLLRAWLGGLASAVILVLLILQLTACGGLYPVETLPAPFRAIHPLLPMTYLVDGLRVTISGGNTSHLVTDVLVLAGFLVGSLALTVLVTSRKRVWTMTERKPELAI